MLIVIAVAAAVVTYSWIMGFIGRATTAPAQTQGRIVIDAVDYYALTGNDNDFLAVYVRNVGSIPVNVSGIYVYSSGTTNLLASRVNFTKQIPTGSIKVIYLRVLETGGISSGDMIALKVTCAEGAAAPSGTVKAESPAIYIAKITDAKTSEISFKVHNSLSTALTASNVTVYTAEWASYEDSSTTFNVTPPTIAANDDTFLKVTGLSLQSGEKYYFVLFTQEGYYAVSAVFTP